MFNETVGAIGDEVIRLLTVQRDYLNELLQSDRILMDKTDGQERSLDRQKAEMWKTTLVDELAKVHDLEMTLAVVGTMKAGKSTTINAIVGREVLPNRNRPMTTLPTMIRHKQGQETPVLYFPKPEPFNQAILEIRDALQEMDEEQCSRLPINAAGDGRILVQQILSGQLGQLESEYHGAEGIYSFLKSLNDISRLCDAKNLNVPSPLMEYTSITELPFIEVEFFHLKDRVQETKGTLTLIDTPGPNEAGQVHLRKILHEQLQKASAVLAVLDYTQLNSEADLEVREAIKEVVQLSQDRLFVMVNKFDQKDHNSMGKEEVKGFVSKELFDDRLPEERIFPVSSQYGYLANYALREIDKNGVLPSPEQAYWVEDFGMKALGLDWEEDLDDIPRVKKSADRLWTKSAFAEPLDKVIAKAYAEAAFMVIKSALEKMDTYDEEIMQYLKMRSGSVHIDIGTLKQMITELENHVALIRKVKQEADQLSAAALKDLTNAFDQIFKHGNAMLQTSIENLFYHGKRMEREQARLEKENSRKNKKTGGILGNFSSLFSMLVPKEETFITISESGLNKFSDKQAAQDFLSKIHAALEEDSLKISRQIQAAVHRFVETTEHHLHQGIRENINPVLEQASSTLNDTFQLQISFQKHTIKPIQVDFEAISENSIDQKEVEKTKTRYVRKWYTLWLKEHAESYTVVENEYHIDTKRIGKQVLNNLKGSQKKLQKDLDVYVNQELSKNISQYFKELELYLDRFLGNLLDGLHDKQENEEALGKLLTAMEKYISIVGLHQEDIRPLREEIRTEILV